MPKNKKVLQKLSMNLKTIGIIIYLIFFGGAIGVFGKFALVSFNAETLIFLRLLIATLFLTLILWQKEKLGYAWHTLKKYVIDFFILALSGIGGGMVLGFLGLSFTTAVNYGLLFNISSIFMAILAVFLLKEKLPFKNIGLLILAFFGTMLIITNGNLQTFTLTASFGDLLVLLGALGWAIYSIYGSYLSKKAGIDSLTLVYNTFIIGLILLCPYLIYTSDFTIVPVTTSALIATILLGIFSTAILFYVWYEIINLGGGILGSFITLGENIGGSIFPILLLNERPALPIWIGGTIILSTILIYEHNKRISQ